jgi:predicted metal-dependent HD superfamily phosphohydrolase
MLETKIMERWKKALSQLLNSLDVPNADSLIEEYRLAYSQPHRKYHNLEHINYLLDALSVVPEPSPALLVAAMYHFFVYDATRADNEEKSAEYLRTKLQVAGVPSTFVDSVAAIMLAPVTSVDMAYASKEAQYLADADMSIYGESPDIYQRYVAAVRLEVGTVADFTWYRQRIRFLLPLLQKERLFYTDEFARLEKHARNNIVMELLTMIDSYERTLLAR